MNQTTKLGGIITLIILLSSGATIYIQDLGEKTGCRAGWEYADGYYGCKTSSGVRYETCFEVYNSTNTPYYWCKKGVRVEPEGPPEPLKSSPGDYICHKRPNNCTII